MQTDLSDSSLFNHKSVMTNEILISVDQYPLISDKKLLAIDATLGGGGHSFELLKKYPNLKIIGLDHDPFARKSAFSKLEEFKSRIEIVPSNFRSSRQQLFRDSMLGQTPTANPARKAAPIAVVSIILGLLTGVLSKSA